MTAPSIAHLLEQLSAEHEELLPRVAELIGLAEAQDGQLAGAVAALAPLLGATLDAHIDQEDSVLFPAYAEASGNEGLTRQFEDEHREIQSLRDDLLALSQDGGARPAALADLTLRLADLLTEHMEREDNMLFPSARQILA